MREHWALTNVLAIGLVCGLSARCLGQARGQWMPGEGDPRGANSMGFPLEGLTTWDPDGPGPMPPSITVFDGGQSALLPSVFVWTGRAWRPVNVGETPPVFSLLATDVGLVAAGNNDFWGGNWRQAIARWSGSQWTPMGAAIPLCDSANSLFMWNGQLVVNAYGSYNNQARLGPWAWNGSEWQPIAGPIGWAYMMGVFEGDLIAGSGELVTGEANLLSRWNGSAWVAWPVLPPVLAVNASAVFDGRLIIAGAGPGPNEGPSQVYAWDGQAWQSMRANMIGAVTTLTVHEGRLICGGEVSITGDRTQYRALIWSGHDWRPFGGGLSGAVNALAPYGAAGAVVGGTFTSGSFQPINYVGVYDGRGFAPLGTGMDGPVTALANMGSEIIAGGSFTGADGLAANHVARWDGARWTQVGEGLGFVPDSLVVFRGDLIAGGGPPGQASPQIKRWDGAAWSTLGAGLGAPPPVGCCDLATAQALAVYHDQLIVGGAFNSAGGQPCDGIASWNGTAWTPMDIGVSGQVYAIAAQGDDLYIGGYLRPTGQTFSTWRVARWTGSRFVLLPGDFHTGPINAMTITERGLLVGGTFFLTVANPTAYGLALWDGSAWQRATTRAAGVNALGRLGADLLVGGSFTVVGAQSGGYLLDGEPSSYLARWRYACAADFDGDGTPRTDADIEAFFACIAGNCCALCQGADFDLDGDSATDADIEAFFRVLGGGSC
jgi:hypothetical protein